MHLHHLHPTPVARAVGGALLLLSLAHAPAVAADTPGTSAATQTHYSVPAGELSTAIAAFAINAKVNVGGAAELMQGVRSPGLQGSYTVPQALAQLLALLGLLLVLLALEQGHSLLFGPLQRAHFRHVVMFDKVIGGLGVDHDLDRGAIVQVIQFGQQRGDLVEKGFVAQVAHGCLLS